MARRKPGRRSFWAPHRIVMRMLFGDERNHPHPVRSARKRLGVGTIASASRDSRTGTVKSRSMRRTEDGWKLDGSRRTRTYRAGETDKPRADRAKSRASQRKADRTARSPRAAAKPTAGKNPNLARNSKRNADGTMNGSVSGAPKMPTPRQAVGLQRLGCPWCRGQGTRPLTTGKGRVKTVIGYAPCAHSWAVPNHGPGQDAPDRRDSLVCPPCQNTGKAMVKVKRPGGREPAAEVPCFTCGGWILHW